MLERLHEEGVYFRRRVTGNPRGTLLYVHGLGESGLCFEETMTAGRLKEWNHIAPDLPGYGRSAWPKQPLELPQFARLVAAWLLAEPARPRILVGHSMGGVIGQMVCRDYPEAADAFFNIEGNVTQQDCTFSGRAASGSLAEFTAGGFDQLKSWVYEAGVDALPMRRYYASMMCCSPDSFYCNSRELVEISQAEQMARDLRDLRVPLRFAAGLRGGLGARSLELLRREQIELVGFDGSGHWPFLDETEAFVFELERFIQGLPERL